MTIWYGNTPPCNGITPSEQKVVPSYRDQNQLLGANYRIVGNGREDYHGTFKGWFEMRCSCFACRMAKLKSELERDQSVTTEDIDNDSEPKCCASGYKNGRTGYSRGCRCDFCKAANAKYKRMYRKVTGLTL